MNTKQGYTTQQIEEKFNEICERVEEMNRELSKKQYEIYSEFIQEYIMSPEIFQKDKKNLEHEAYISLLSVERDIWEGDIYREIAFVKICDLEDQ